MNLYESIVKESADGKPCVICGKSFTGWGNDPWPVKEEGYCCDKCNMEVVLPARLALLAKSEQEKKAQSEEIKESDGVREYSNALIDLCEQGGASWESIARGLIDYCSEDDIKDFCISEDILNLDNQEELEESDDLSRKINSAEKEGLKIKKLSKEDLTDEMLKDFPNAISGICYLDIKSYVGDNKVDLFNKDGSELGCSFFSLSKELEDTEESKPKYITDDYPDWIKKKLANEEDVTAWYCPQCDEYFERPVIDGESFKCPVCRSDDLEKILITFDSIVNDFYDYHSEDLYNELCERYPEEVNSDTLLEDFGDDRILDLIKDLIY